MWPRFNQNWHWECSLWIDALSHFIQQQPEGDPVLKDFYFLSFPSQRRPKTSWQIKQPFVPIVLFFLQWIENCRTAKCWWSGYLFWKKMEIKIGLHATWAARWRLLAEGDSPPLLLFLSLLLLSLSHHFCHHHHRQLLLLPPFRLLYLWLCPLVWKKLSSGPVDLEME